MKRIILFLVISTSLCIVLPLLYSHLSLSKNAKEHERENIEAPYEYFSQIRSFPDSVFDYKAYSRALVQEQQTISANRSTSTGTWQFEGPTNIGGRITAFKIHPTNSAIMLAGCPGGGLFRTTNSGVTWTPVFDTQTHLSVGCLAFNPGNPNVVYAGTGDPDMPQSCLVGNGIYRSLDGGITWNSFALTNHGVITQILINPTNTLVMYASSMGTPMVRNNIRGVYKSIDGGLTWTQVLFINNETGVSDLVMDHTNPNIIYAAGFSRIRTNTESLGYSMATRLYKTTNGGTTWSIIHTGLPNTKLSRFGICMSKQNPNKLYVSVCDSTYNLENIYVTTNGGASFAVCPGSSAASTNFGGFGWYFGRIEVSPTNDNIVFTMGIEHYKSTDGGTTFNLNQPPWWNYNPHADIHGIQFKSPTNYIIATDGGLFETTDDGLNYARVDNIPNTQFYRVNYNPFAVAEYAGGTQDNGTNIGGAASGLGSWFSEFGGDGFQPRFDFNNSMNRYVETQNGNLWVSIDGGSTYNSFDATLNSSDRRNWDMPYVFGGGTNTAVMLTGTYRVYKTTSNPVDNWVPISPDLTDGIIYAPRFHNISAIDNSRLNANHIYAGTSDGNVWRSLNGGTTWDSLQMTLPYRYVTSIHPSPNVVNNLYVTHSGYRYNQYIPHIHKSIDNGTNWTDISSNLPQAGINDVLIVNGYENVLFVANDLGVYYTLNSGVYWTRLGINMPLIVVADLEYNPTTKQLIAGTYARGIYTYDITGLLSTVGKNELLSKSFQLNLFPNPTSSLLNVKGVDDGSLIQLMDLSGKILKTETRTELDVRELPGGVYFIKARIGGHDQVKQFIKQ